MPLSDRDYMQRRPPPTRVSLSGFGLNPVWVIIAINFIVFIATLINRNLVVNLGLVPMAFWERPWTILTNMFVHAGFGHIFGNMLTLFFFGRFLTMLVGSNKFLLVYFVGGIVGNILYLLLGEPLSVAVGASGAVSAIAGVLVVMMPNLRVHLYLIFPMPLWVVVLVFFVLWSFIPGLGIAWQAHIGGLLVGLIAGYFFKKKGRYYYFV